LEYRNVGRMEEWKNGVMGYWSDGVMEYRNVGVLFKTAILLILSRKISEFPVFSVRETVPGFLFPSVRICG
jgi:hypothetical protein